MLKFILVSNQVQYTTLFFLQVSSTLPHSELKKSLLGGKVQQHGVLLPQISTLELPPPPPPFSPTTLTNLGNEALLTTLAVYCHQKITDSLPSNGSCARRMLF